MKYYSFSIADVKKEAKKLADKVKESGFEPDLVFFIASGGFFIGKTVAEETKTELHAVLASRGGGKIKKIISPIIRITPSKIRFWLIELEMRLGFHQRSKERNVVVSKKTRELAGEDINKVLIVDDAVDTGNSMISVISVLQTLFPRAKIKTAALCVIHYSKKILETDYYIYRDTIIKTATSKDSAENGKFIEEYNEWLIENSFDDLIN